MLGARAGQPRGGEGGDQGLRCEARRAVSGPKGDFWEEAVSAWCKGRTTERGRGLGAGPAVSGKEGGLGAERGFLGGGYECLVQGQDSREGERVGIRACGVRQEGRSWDREGIFGRRL